jgi:photosystem II stability/assembly factor-like uncharacterized protein
MMLDASCASRVLVRTATLAAFMALAPYAASAYKDPLEVPAQASAMAERSPLFGVAQAGRRIVAVGARGHIVFSDDTGTTWKQAKVPSSTDLVAVSFPSDTQGWAVGHGGIVLHTEDAGQTWTRQLDGLQAARITMDFYANASAGSVSDAVLRQAKGQLQDAERGAPAPLLDVWFESDRVGFVVGAFNRILQTQDGGKTWTPWMARIDNPQELNLYAIRGDGDERFIVGEQGMVWRLDSQTRRFVAVPTPYKGTLFGVVVAPSAVVAFGMNGTAFRSTDRGRSWEKSEIGSRAGLTAGAASSGGQVLLVNIAGQLLRSDDQGKTFALVKSAAFMPSYFGVARLHEGRLSVVGSAGIKVLALP